ncbi:inositol monophosphatase family protein [Sphingomonas sp. CFBP 13720]|uniref:inositol monophosphatase family protein n=1 Tax=Sphingomonas sp. CFBP 13720 TaxID=2775302 RepID=UPI0017845903|nr:inositol monophosphatase [Sphingomonas sp. CFBP 13720]
MTESITPLLRDVRGLVVEMMPTLLDRRYDVRWKSDGSPVTEADIFLEKRMTHWLGERLPGLQVIGEESFREGGSPRSRDGWVAVLDPVDGTENFCSGLKEWGVSLSLWHGGEHAGSLLMLPELGDWMATGEPIERVRSRITGYSSSIHPAIAAGISEGGEARIFGCAVYNIFNVTRGALARFVNPKGARSWDLLAGLMLAREHDCEILIDGQVYDGAFLEPDRRYRVDIRHRYDLHSGQGAIG